MAESKLDLLQGTLDLMGLETLVTMGPCTATALPGASSR